MGFNCISNACICENGEDKQKELVTEPNSPVVQYQGMQGGTFSQYRNHSLRQLRAPDGSLNFKDNLNESEVNLHAKSSLTNLLKMQSRKTSSSNYAKPLEAFSIDMFKYKRMLGKGSYGQVHLVKKQMKYKDKHLFALKQIQKDMIIKYQKTTAVFRERDLMNRLKEAEARYVLHIHLSFQDDRYLYFLMEYVAGMTLQQMIQTYGRLPPYVYKTVAAMIVIALEDMQALEICHRDLKPGNILFTEDFQIRIVDFGEAKMVENQDLHKTQIQRDFLKNYNITSNTRLKTINEDKNDAISLNTTKFDNQDQEQDETEFFQRMFSGETLSVQYLYEEDNTVDKNFYSNDQQMRNKVGKGSFVGTPVYQSPEMIMNNTSGPFTDLWALGVIIYQMITGQVPWKYQGGILDRQNKIIHKKFNYPDYVTEDEKDIINRLLELDPLQRLGQGDPFSSNSMDALKNHPFFSSINMSQIEKYIISPTISLREMENFKLQNQNES